MRCDEFSEKEPTVATLSSAEVANKLESKFGFEVSQGDHTFFELYVEERLVSRTKISHGGKADISGGLLHAMAHQCHVTAQVFREMIGCTVSRDEYLRMQEVVSDPDEDQSTLTAEPSIPKPIKQRHARTRSRKPRRP